MLCCPFAGSPFSAPRTDVFGHEFRILFAHPFDEARDLRVRAKLFERVVDASELSFAEDRMQLVVADLVDGVAPGAAIHARDEVMLVDGGSGSHLAAAKWA